MLVSSFHFQSFHVFVMFVLRDLCFVICRTFFMFLFGVIVLNLFVFVIFNHFLFSSFSVIFCVSVFHDFLLACFLSFSFFVIFVSVIFRDLFLL